MDTLLIVLVLLVAAEHVFILWLEMFAIPSALAARVFGISQAVQSQPEIRRLFANQGLYNGFLAAGLIWSVLAGPPLAAPLQLFFLTCVVVAAVYGAATANKAILWKQGGPAIAALLVSSMPMASMASALRRCALACWVACTDNSLAALSGAWETR